MTSRHLSHPSAAYLAATAASVLLAATAMPSATAHPSPRANQPGHYRDGQLRVREGGAGAATGHIGIPIRFRNRSHRTCSLRGYPDAAGLNKHGKQVTQAKRTKRGFIGGLKPGHKIPTVVLHPGQVASALVEGTDVPQGTRKHCRELHGLLVTPPNDHRAHHFRDAPPDCSRIQIHPVVKGKDGSQIS
jgi:hypothetical protein